MKKLVRGLLLILSIFFLQSCLCPPEKLDITDCMLYDRQNDIILELNAYADGNYIATGVQSDTGYGIHFAAGTTWGCIGLKSISDAMWLAKITDSALLSTNGFARLRVQE